MKKKIVSILCVMMMTAFTACGNAKIAEKTELKPVGNNKKAEEQTEVEQTKAEQKQLEQKQSEQKQSEQNQEEIGKELSKDTIEKFNTFGLELFQKNNTGKNPVISPLSAYLALHMAAEGAAGNTKTEFEKLMGNLDEQTILATIAKSELPANKDNMKFAIADSVWVDDSFEVNDKWLERVLTDKKDKAFQMDLSTKEAAEQMNDWVKKSTDGMIDNLIDKPLPDATRMVLFDALYMNGKWEKTFSKENTQEEDFFIKPEQAKKVSMMNQYQENYRYFENDAIEGCVLPYQDSSLVFVALKAKNQKMEIRNVLDGLDTKELLELVRTSYTKEINLKLPSFEIAYEKSLNEALKKMGLVDAFDGQSADFSNMGTTKNGYPIYIDLVYQKAKVNVDEEGTKAAAVTEIVMLETTSLMEEEPPYDLYFNQPFFYMIMDTNNNIPVFMGIVDEP